MQVRIFELLRDRQQRIETGVEYVEILREYWTARGVIDGEDIPLHAQWPETTVLVTS
jgi:hypothetical protein